TSATTFEHLFKYDYTPLFPICQSPKTNKVPVRSDLWRTGTSGLKYVLPETKGRIQAVTTTAQNPVAQVRQQFAAGRACQCGSNYISI
ncbi:MAG: hypothetical protein IJO98_04530, partial [Clostridia bacterium]|nr:hypothetical protein [Clostridia bacterium]